LNFWEKLQPKADPPLAGNKSASASRRDEPFFVLAPMADVTDAAFRQIILQCGKPDILYTEFISCDGLCSRGRERLTKDLIFTENEHPIVAQFFGSKPENFYQCAKLAKKLGFDGVDINMGCPDRKMIRQGAGIGLCKTPELAREIIRATQEGAGNIPVSVKTRLGLYEIDLAWIQNLLDAKIPALIVHGRTMKEMSKVPAHWDIIGEVAKMAKDTGTLIVGNGDIMSRQEGIERAQQYGIDGIMVGRGIFHNPWFFSTKNKPASDHNTKDRLDLLLRHTQLFVHLWGDTKSFDLMKKFYKVYVSGWDGAKDLRIQLMNVKNEQQVREIIERYAN